MRQGLQQCPLHMSAPFSSTADALSWATNQLRATSDTARLDAELLLAHVLGWSRARILAERQERLSEVQQAALRDLVVRRAALEPIAYLMGHDEFDGLDFLVDRHVLIPRAETELLVDRTLAVAQQMTTNHRPMPSSEAKGPTTEDRDSKIEERNLSTRKTRSSIRNPPSSNNPSVVGRRPSVVIADIGTGSGCIAVALAVHLPEAMIYAVDISPEALRVARRNIERHGVVERIRPIEGDLLDALPEAVDVLVSNPPYTILNEID